MLNVEDLQQRWIRYKIKSYIPHGVIAISSLIIVFVSLFFINTEINAPKNTIAETKTIKRVATPAQATSSIASHREQDRIKEHPKKMVLSPSVAFITHHKKQTPLPKPPKVQKQREIITKPLVKVEEIPKEVSIVHQQHINIKREESDDDIGIIIKRFQKTNNPELSLFIAKKYYAMKKYREAYNYALITNKINNNIEGSWIIFSKSLVKLGKKRLALKVLNQYLGYSNSNKAEILRDEIISGKFR